MDRQKRCSVQSAPPRLARAGGATSLWNTRGGGASEGERALAAHLTRYTCRGGGRALLWRAPDWLWTGFLPFPPRLPSPRPVIRCVTTLHGECQPPAASGWLARPSRSASWRPIPPAAAVAAAARVEGVAGVAAAGPPRRVLRRRGSPPLPGGPSRGLLPRGQWGGRRPRPLWRLRRQRLRRRAVTRAVVPPPPPPPAATARTGLRWGPCGRDRRCRDDRRLRYPPRVRPMRFSLPRPCRRLLRRLQPRLRAVGGSSWTRQQRWPPLSLPAGRRRGGWRRLRRRRRQRRRRRRGMRRRRRGRGRGRWSVWRLAPGGALPALRPPPWTLTRGRRLCRVQLLGGGSPPGGRPLRAWTCGGRRRRAPFS